MRWPSVLAIYFLVWAMCLFLVLPFRLQRREGADEAVPGQADGAPPRFSLARTCGWTTIVSAALFALFYLNYVEGWVTPDRLDLVPDRVIEGR